MPRLTRPAGYHPLTMPTARSILAQTAHRPWPPPRRPWAMRMTWRNLLFAHWPVDPRSLRPFIPAPLAIEEHGGTAWVGVIPFLMDRVRPHFLPPCRRPIASAS